MFGFLIMTVGIFFYHAARIFVPFYIIFLGFLFVFSKKLYGGSRRSIISIVIGICIFCVLVVFTQSGRSRVNLVSIFTDQESQLILYQQIREDQFQNVVITKYFHNKIISYSTTFLRNYYEYLSGGFLFFPGGSFPKRYAIPYTGNMFPIDIIFLLSGLWSIILDISTKKRMLYFIPLFWLLAGPIPAALTFEDIPNIRRSIYMLPGLMLIIGMGMSFMYEKLFSKSNKLYLFPILTVYIYLFSLFYHVYWHHSAKHDPYFRAVSERELTGLLDTLSNRKTPIIATTDGDNVQLFYLFYWKIDPNLYHSMAFYRPINAKKLLNITFVPEVCPLMDNTKVLERTIFVNRATCKNINKYISIYNIQRPDGSDDYTVYEVSSNIRNTQPIL